MSSVLFKYIFKIQLKAMLLVSFFIFCLIALFDFAEVIRIFPIHSRRETLYAVKLAFLRGPHTFCEILHYIYFITATFSLWHLMRSHQITILKSSGRSPQQILHPFIGFAIFIALIWLFLLHPLGQFSEKCYNECIIHDKTIPKTASVENKCSEVNKNIWIEFPEDNKLVFIRNLINNKVDGLYIFNTKGSGRLFASEAELLGSKWALKNVNLIQNDEINNRSHLLIDLAQKSLSDNEISAGTNEKEPGRRKPGHGASTTKAYHENGTSINHPEEIYGQSFDWMRNISEGLISMLSIPPKKHDIYTLYKVYEIQQNSKIALRLYEMELHKLLANAVTFILFALIAAIICFPINRYKTKTNISIKIIISAITLRFFNNIFESFAHSGILSVQLACWSVVLILLCLSMAVLIWKEA